MAKKSLVFIFLELSGIFLWLFFIGQLSGVSGISGDINFIDEGQFAAWIHHMLDGKMPYRDIYIQYGPLQVYPIYVLAKFFGETIFFVRLVSGVLGVFFGICVAFLLLKRLKLHPLIFYLTIFFLILIPGVHIRHWIGILCILLVIQAFGKQSSKLAFISGVVLMIALLGSIEVGIFSTLVIAGYILLRFLHSPTSGDVRVIRVTVFGFFLSLFIFALFAAQQGWLVHYIKTTMEVLTSLSGVNLPNGQGLPNIFVEHRLTFSPFGILQFLFSKAMLFYWSLFLLLLFLSIAIIRFILQKTTKEETIIILILCFGILVYASIVGRSGHYFVVVPILLVCASYFVSLVFPPNRMKDTGSRNLAMLIFALFILYATRHIAIFRYTQFFNVQAREDLRRDVPRVAPLAISKSQARDILGLQEFFIKNTAPTDTIFVLNNLPALYFLLDRENSTRYDLPLLAVSREKRLEIVSSFRKHPPLYIIEDQNAWAVDNVPDRRRLPEVVEYIEKYYGNKETLGHYIIRKRVGSLPR